MASTPISISVSKERKPKESNSRSSVDYTDQASTPTGRKETLKPKKDESVNGVSPSPILKKKNGTEEETNGHSESKESPVVPGSSPRKEESVTDATNGVDDSKSSIKKFKLEDKKKARILVQENFDSEEETNKTEDEEEDDDIDPANASEEYKAAKERIRKEKERLKREEEKIRKEEQMYKKKAKEDVKETWKKEKERLKKEKDEALKKVKEDLRKEEQRLYRRDSQAEDQDLMSGWIKMRSTLKNWHLRYFVLIPGKLIYYKDEFEKDCAGIILLAGCEVKVRQSKKDGFCFKIWHPKQANIYSSKGLKGEPLASGMVPLSADHCILRVTTEEERNNWITAISQALGAKSKRKSSASGHFDDPKDMLDDDVSDNSPSSSPASKTLDEVKFPAEDQKETKSSPSKQTSPSTSIVASSSKRAKKPIKETVYVSEAMEDILLEEGVKEEQLAAESNSLIMSLLKQVKIGMDLSRVALPTFILEPRSMLEKLSDFLTHAELLTRVPSIQDPLGRMIGLVKWYLSGFYIKPRGVKKPYNPILGEMFRAMWHHKDTESKTFYIAEQVSHHPPISAFYASNRKAGFIVNGSIVFRSKFLGTSAASILDGFATIVITPFDEEYEITFPSVYAKGFLFGTLLMELVGPVQVVCKKTGYTAEMEFKAKPVIGGEYNVLHAKIKHLNETLYTIRGKWDGRIEIKNSKTQTSEVLWEPSSETRRSRLPKHKPPIDQMKDFESDKLWTKVTDAIKKGDQRVATDEKAVLEEAQREAAKRRQQLGVEYKPKLFRKDESGVWVYKYSNKAPFNPSEEIEEYEYEGIVRSKLVNEEGSEDESEDEEAEDKKASITPVASSEALVPVNDQEPETAVVAEVNGIKTHLSSMNALPADDKWKKQVEGRLLAIEKALILLQHKKSEPVKSKSSTKITLLALVVLIVIYFLMK